MKPFTFCFTATDSTGKSHECSIDLSDAVVLGFYNECTADHIVFGSISSSVNDFDELVFMGRQSEEVRSFFYDLLWLGVTDRRFGFLIPDDYEHCAYEENFMRDGILTHIELWHDHKGYHSLIATFDPVSARCTSCHDLTFDSFSHAFANFYDYIESCSDAVSVTCAAARDIINRVDTIESFSSESYQE